MSNYRHAKVAPYQEFTLTKLTALIVLIVACSVLVKHGIKTASAAQAQEEVAELPFEDCKAKTWAGEFYGRECQLQAQLKGIE